MRLLEMVLEVEVRAVGWAEISAMISGMVNSHGRLHLSILFC